MGLGHNKNERIAVLKATNSRLAMLGFLANANFLVLRIQGITAQNMGYKNQRRLSKTHHL